MAAGKIGKSAHDADTSRHAASTPTSGSGGMPPHQGAHDYELMFSLELKKYHVGHWRAIKLTAPAADAVATHIGTTPNTPGERSVKAAAAATAAAAAAADTAAGPATTSSRSLPSGNKLSPGKGAGRSRKGSNGSDDPSPPPPPPPPATATASDVGGGDGGGGGASGLTALEGVSYYHSHAGRSREWWVKGLGPAMQAAGAVPGDTIELRKGPGRSIIIAFVKQGQHGQAHAQGQHKSGLAEKQERQQEAAYADAGAEGDGDRAEEVGVVGGADVVGSGCQQGVEEAGEVGADSSPPAADAGAAGSSRKQRRDRTAGAAIELVQLQPMLMLAQMEGGRAAKRAAMQKITTSSRASPPAKTTPAAAPAAAAATTTRSISKPVVESETEVGNEGDETDRRGVGGDGGGGRTSTSRAGSCGTKKRRCDDSRRDPASGSGSGSWDSLSQTPPPPPAAPGGEPVPVHGKPPLASAASLELLASVAAAAEADDAHQQQQLQGQSPPPPMLQALSQRHHPTLSAGTNGGSRGAASASGGGFGAAADGVGPQHVQPHVQPGPVPAAGEDAATINIAAACGGDGSGDGGGVGRIDSSNAAPLKGRRRDSLWEGSTHPAAADSAGPAHHHGPGNAPAAELSFGTPKLTPRPAVAITSAASTADLDQGRDRDQGLLRDHAAAAGLQSQHEPFTSPGAGPGILPCPDQSSSEAEARSTACHVMMGLQHHDHQHQHHHQHQHQHQMPVGPRSAAGRAIMQAAWSANIQPPTPPPAQITIQQQQQQLDGAPASFSGNTSAPPGMRNPAGAEVAQHVAQVLALQGSLAQAQHAVMSGLAFLGQSRGRGMARGQGQGQEHRSEEVKLLQVHAGLDANGMSREAPGGAASGPTAEAGAGADSGAGVLDAFTGGAAAWRGALRAAWRANEAAVVLALHPQYPSLESIKQRLGSLMHE